MSASEITATLTAMKSVLEAAAPARVVTDVFLPFDVRPDAELLAGVLTILFVGVPAYDYEHTLQFDGIDHIQTDNALIEISVVGQIRVAENATGAQLATAEIALLTDIEKLANAGISDSRLNNLRLISAKCSSQMEAPYGWIYTLFQTRADGE